MEADGAPSESDACGLPNKCHEVSPSTVSVSFKLSSADINTSVTTLYEVKFKE